MEITKSQARQFLLAHQGLVSPYQFKGKRGMLTYIRRVGCVQYDPLYIAGKNAELVLQARVAGFTSKMLAESLYKERTLIDGWDKLASIYAVEDWPYFRRWRDSVRQSSPARISSVHSALVGVRALFKKRGPLSSLDIELNEKVDGGWDWAGSSRLARAVLDNMYLWGELVVHHRVHTRKIYDFAHRHLPKELLKAADPNKTEEQYQDWHVLRRIRSVGMMWNRSLGAWYGMSAINSKQRTLALGRLLDQGKLSKVQVEGIKEPLYLCTQDKRLLNQTMKKSGPSPRAMVMAPLDNLLWDRQLLRDLFNFDYLWEVYVPAEKRRYGYYVLPILYGDRFIARFEPEREKTRGVMTIKNWWWEKDITPNQQMKSDLVECLQRFLGFLNVSGIEVDPLLQKQAGLEWLVTAFS